MDIDIYDFDGTIVPFDSGSLFAGYCLLHYPYLILLLPFAAPILIIALILMLMKMISFNWFADRKRYSVVISASPDFLLEEIQKRLGFEKLICTKHNRATGAIIGENCRDEEKVKRLYLEFGKNEINVIDVYSDSLKHDGPIFSLANGGCYHIVKSEKVLFKYDDVY